MQFTVPSKSILSDKLIWDVHVTFTNDHLNWHETECSITCHESLPDPLASRYGTVYLLPAEVPLSSTQNDVTIIDTGLKLIIAIPTTVLGPVNPLSKISGGQHEELGWFNMITH